MIDFEITEDMDIDFNGKGDILTTETIETSALCGLFFERRFNDQRGHFGFDENEGSKLWTLDQSRINNNTLNESALFARQGLSFLDNVAVNSTINNNGIILNIEIKSEDNIERKEFIL